MNRIVASGVQVALSASLAIAGGFALGYVRGYRDALGSVWDLRREAQCLDPSTSAEAGSDRTPHGLWVWKRGELAGKPVEQWTHSFFLPNPFEGTPALKAVGNRLPLSVEVDVANWRPPGFEERPS